MIGEAPRPCVDTAQVMLRDATSDDLDAVMAIMGAAFEPAYGEGWTRSQCAGILPMAGVALRLALRGDGAVTGFALMRVIADEAELLLIAVDPAARQNGVGSALVADFLARAGQDGARRCHLEVRDGNAAIGIYERAGFRIVGRRLDFYRGLDGHKSDALTLASER